jgi:RNA polymerase sigma factor (TIGR02999 family)
MHDAGRTTLLGRGDVTGLLSAWQRGDREAGDHLVRLLYTPLRAIARARLSRERRGHTLQPTALVHEAYLRLAREPLGYRDRAHFLAACAETMRRVLVDHARRRQACKRGQGAPLAELDELERRGPQTPHPERNLVALSEALERLAQLDARQSRIVELRFFGGLTHEQVSAVVGLAPRTVKLEWAKARTWLYRELFRD